MNFGPRAAAVAGLLFSHIALADKPPPVVLAEPPAAALPGESFKNRLEFSFGFGVGTCSPSQYNGYVGAFNQAAGGPPAGANVNTEIHVAFPIVTYYFPYYLLLRSGFEPVSIAFPGETLGADHINNYGGTAEIPIEFGGHFSLLQDQLVLDLAAGPAIGGFTSAGLSGSNGPTGEQLYANPSLGFDSELQAQYFLSKVFSLGLGLGYRILSSGPLHTSDNTNVVVGGNTVNLDMSGFHVELMLGFAVL